MNSIFAICLISFMLKSLLGNRSYIGPTMHVWTTMKTNALLNDSLLDMSHNI